MPRQTPSTGTRRSIAASFSGAARPRWRKVSMALSNAPTPGSTSLSAAAMLRASALASAS